MAKLVFIKDERAMQCKEAEFYQLGSRVWDFCAPLSHRLESLDGPLKFGLNDHHIDPFAELRIRSIFKDIFGREEFSTHKAGDIGRSLRGPFHFGPFHNVCNMHFRYYSIFKNTHNRPGFNFGS
jgi:hypothetical protein